MYKPKLGESGTSGKIGIYSGTFDPVHTGHIEFALQVAKHCGLEKVVLLPEKYPREKENAACLADRVEMLNLACKEYDNLEVVLLEDERFTVNDTLPVLQHMYGGSQLVYLCGSDHAKTFLYRWEGLKILLENVQVAVGLRNEDTEADVQAIFDELKHTEGVETLCGIFKAPRHYLASTMVRNGTHTLADIDPAVAAYIARKNLYS